MLGWELPPYNSGGLGVACYFMSKALAKNGADIDFVLPSHAEYDEIDFMNTFRVPQSRVTKHIVHSRNPYDIDMKDFDMIREDYVAFAAQHAVKTAAEVIHAHDWLTLEAGVAAKNASGAPLIAHVHATEFDRAGGYGNPMIHEIEHHGLMAADHIFAVSAATKRIITERYQIPAEKIEVVHNGVEALPEHITDRLQYRYLELLKNEGYTIIAVISRLTIQKGLGYFLEAAAKAHRRYGRMVFVIAGDGEVRNELIGLSAELGISDAVIFTGFIRGKAWRDMYSLADVFVMSSVSEPFGITALEAAQHDTAITLTRQSGVGEVLQHVLRYDFWDVDKLADQLLALSTTSSLRSTLAKNVASEVERLSWRSVANKMLTRYGKMTRLPQ